MANEFFGGKARRKVMLGAKLDRATATIPASTYEALFTITGGRVVVTSMVGEVTTVLGATATNLKITATPTTGTAVDVASNLAVASKEAGCLFGVGVFAAAMIGANAGATSLPTTPFVVPIGTLGITTSATNTGSIKWSATYIPYDDGAEMVVA